MFTPKLRVPIVALAGALALAVPAAALAQNPVEWNYNPRDHRARPLTQPSPSVAYPLQQSAISQVLVFGFTPCWPTSAAAGVDLEEDTYNGSVQQSQWKFIRQHRHPRTNSITGTEGVALYNSWNGEYLLRGDQTFGISLDYSATPSYEWHVAAGGGANGANIELYNVPEQAYLVDPFADGGPWPPNKCGPPLAWLHAPFSLPAGYQAPPDQLLAPPIGLTRAVH